MIIGELALFPAASRIQVALPRDTKPAVAPAEVELLFEQQYYLTTVRVSLAEADPPKTALPP